MATETERRTVRVACSVVNGITLRVFKTGYDDGTGDGVRPIVEDGPKVVLNGVPALHTGAGNTEGVDQEPGVTEVDADYMERWMEQNRLNPLVGMGFVKILEEERADPDWPPQASAIDKPDGFRARGSTGQLFSALAGRWVRVTE